MLTTVLIESENYQFDVSLFESSKISQYTMICIPAMGVRASYYKEFANQLCSSGFNVILMELRGHGNSSIIPSHTIDFGYVELLEDLDNIVDYIGQRFSSTKIVIIGHSLGGQIGSLYVSANPVKIDRIILITSCSVFYKGWSNLLSLKIYLAGKLFPTLSLLLGYFPGTRIGFGGRESKTIIKDWSNTVLNGTYILENSSVDYEFKLSKLNKKILSLSIEKDYLASKRAIMNLLNKFSKESMIKQIHLTGKDVGIENLNHFNWTKKPLYVVNLINEWLI